MKFDYVCRVRLNQDNRELIDELMVRYPDEYNNKSSVIRAGLYQLRKWVERKEYNRVNKILGQNSPLNKERGTK